MAQTGRLRKAIENFLLEFSFGTVISEILRFTRESDEVELVALLSGILDLLIRHTKNIPELNNLFKDLKARKHQVGAGALVGIAEGVGTSTLNGLLSPVFQLLNQELNKEIKGNILGPQEALLGKHYGILTGAQFVEAMLRHGYNEDKQSQLFQISQRRLDVPELTRALLRFPEDSVTINKMILERGWHPNDLSLATKLAYYFPSPGDLITWSVREAFNEQQVEALGLDRNFPTDAAALAKRAGMEEKYFRYAWRSHWQLPSISHAFEFLHRLRPGRANVSFTAKDFASLLVALDISPQWHDMYKAVSYAPIGRVDLRRIYKTTNKDRSWLVEQYQDVDYSPIDAETLADWTIIDAEQSLRDASLSTIEKSVERGILTEGEAQVALEALKYGADDIKIYLANWRYAREDKRISAEIDYLKVRYLAAELTEEQLRSELNNLGLSPNNIAIAMANLNAQRKRQVVALSVGQIEDMYEENILDYNQMVAELEARGTTKINAKRLAQLIDVKRQRKTDKELEAAMKEQERIEASEAKSDKQIATAELQVQIATRNAEVADLKKIYPDITDLDTLTAIETRLAEIKQEVAYLQLEKTKVNLQYAERIETNA